MKGYNILGMFTVALMASTTIEGLFIHDTLPYAKPDFQFGKTGGGSPSKHGQSLKQHKKNRKAAKAQKQARRKQRQ